MEDIPAIQAEQDDIARFDLIGPLQHHQIPLSADERQHAESFGRDRDFTPFLQQFHHTAEQFVVVDDQFSHCFTALAGNFFVNA